MPKVKRVCMQCGVEFETWPAEIRKGGGKFCSRSCRATYNNLKNNPAKRPEVRKKISDNHADVSGEKNPMYGRRGELAPSYIDGRKAALGNVAKYRAMLWASGVEKKCKICGSEVDLDVHHIDGDHSNNVLENLVYLCRRCHRTIAHKSIRDSKGRFMSKERE